MQTSSTNKYTPPHVRRNGPSHGAQTNNNTHFPWANTKKRSDFVWSTNDPAVMDGLNPYPLRRIERPDALPGHRNVQPRNLRPVSGYNWTGRAQPTIIVPGCPRIWKDKSAPFHVPRDSGELCIDQNENRFPKYPLLPLFAAIDHFEPDFSFTSMDIITDRNNLRKLTRFVGGSDSSESDFRIDLQLVGQSTVLFVRHEREVPDSDPGRRGYGHNFEMIATKPYPGCEESITHHRIITYDLSGMRVLLRYKVDACLYNGTPKQPVPSLKQNPSQTTNVEDMIALLRVSSFSNNNNNNHNGKDTNSSSSPTIKVISAGELVEQNSIIELTARSNRSLQDGLDWRKIFPQLFLSQTPHHYLGVHTNGNFQRIEHSLLECGLATNDQSGQRLRGIGALEPSSISSVCQANCEDKHQSEQQTSFDRLRALLQNIHDLVVAAGITERLSLVYKQDTGEMHIFKRISSADALPKSWMLRLNGETE